jgi:hypothetical protein
VRRRWLWRGMRLSKRDVLRIQRLVLPWLLARQSVLSELLSVVTPGGEFFGALPVWRKPFTGRYKRKNAESFHSRRFALTRGYRVSAVKTRAPRTELS